MEYGEELSSEDMKIIQKDILDYVADFCEENGINYWLDAGTLIGAIRHKGFIPWDDDIDIGMLKDDFEKFKKIFDDTKSKYKFSCQEKDKNLLVAFGKVMDTSTIMLDSGDNETCVNIDILVWDNAPDDDKEFEKLYNRRNLYMIFNGAKIGCRGRNKLKNTIRRIIKVFVLPFPKNYFVKKIMANAIKYDSKETKRVANLRTKVSKSWIINKEYLSKFEYKEFEGKKYKVPYKYDEYLKAIYGDYMQLPPEKDRIGHHFCKAYRKV